MLNQIFIANKQHMDLKPCQVYDLEMDADQIDADKLLKEKLFQDKIRKQNKKKDKFNELNLGSTHDDCLLGPVLIPST